MNQQTSTAVTRLEPSRLPINAAIAKEFEVTSAEWRVLVDQIFPAAKSIEAISMALAYCRQRKLDIFKKPVHIVPMWSSAKKQMVETVWPGIAEIRTTAFRTGEYAGIDEVVFGPMVERLFKSETSDRNGEVQTVNKAVQYPEFAKVTAYRLIKGTRCAFHATVYWEEAYAAVGKTTVPNDMWAKRPRGQLDKCVEAAVLRKAFPEELGGTYTAEEMEGREIDVAAVVSVEAPKPPVPPRPPIAQIAAPVEDAKTIDTAAEDTSSDVGLDDTAFFEDLENQMSVANDAVTIEEVWTGADPMARFEGDETNQSIAMAIKRRALKRIGGAT